MKHERKLYKNPTPTQWAFMGLGAVTVLGLGAVAAARRRRRGKGNGKGNGRTGRDFINGKEYAWTISRSNGQYKWNAKPTTPGATEERSGCCFDSVDQAMQAMVDSLPGPAFLPVGQDPDFAVMDTGQVLEVPASVTDQSIVTSTDEMVASAAVDPVNMLVVIQGNAKGVAIITLVEGGIQEQLMVEVV